MSKTPNIKPYQYRVSKKGAVEVRPRFRKTKHKGYCAGAFGRPVK